MPKMTILQGKESRDVSFTGTPLLSAIMQEQGLRVDMPCGGRGVCGKCALEASGALSPETAQERQWGTRLACQTHLLGDARVTLPVPHIMENIAASGDRPFFALSPMQGQYGMAVDIGTTTLAATLLSLKSGEILASSTAENPQRSIAADVIGRMEAAMAGKAELLKRLIEDRVEQLRKTMCAQMAISISDIDQTVITGNTTMLYLLTGRATEPLSHAPFRADFLFGHRTLFAGMPAYIPQCISAFVGADITCAILSSQMCRHSDSALLVDIGTNGEVALRHKGKLYVCATAAGPAFEGGGIQYGCGSVAGAIDHVWAQDDRIAFSTIGSAKPVGICGSGIIDAVAVLLGLGHLDETGMLREERVQLETQAAVTQKDIRNVQLAKSAIIAGILTLCKKVGVDLNDIAVLYLAGGFGKHIDIGNASAIGLIPQSLAGRTKVIGNASLVGAEMLLLQKSFLHETESYAKKCEVVTLSGNPVFSEYYISCMMLEPV